MQTYAAGQDLTFDIPFVDAEGQAISLTGLTHRLLDIEGNLLQTGSVSVAGDATAYALTLAASVNTLNNGDLSTLRTLEVELQTTLGAVIRTEIVYLLRAKNILNVLGNSFQTYSEALVTASQMPAQAGFASASTVDQENALIEAFGRLTRIGYRVRRPEDVDAMNYIADTDEVIAPRYWPVMPMDRWNSLPDRFKTALKKAQVAEANEILSGNVIADKRRLGLLSESIGESSMMFRSGKPLDLGVASVSLTYLTGFVDTRITITRS